MDRTDLFVLLWLGTGVAMVLHIVGVWLHWWGSSGPLYWAALVGLLAQPLGRYV